MYLCGRLPACCTGLFLGVGLMCPHLQIWPWRSRYPHTCMVCRVHTSMPPPTYICLCAKVSACGYLDDVGHGLAVLGETDDLACEEGGARECIKKAPSFATSGTHYYTEA